MLTKQSHTYLEFLDFPDELEDSNKLYHIHAVPFRLDVTCLGCHSPCQPLLALDRVGSMDVLETIY